MKIAIILTFAPVLLVGLLTEPVHSQQTTNWGPVVNGVQMSISSTTTVSSVGSNLTIIARIRNPSTNIPAICVNGDPTMEFSLSLTDKAGKEQDPNPLRAMRVAIHNHFEDIPPGQIYECPIPVQIRTGIEPGKYVLRAKRLMLFRVDGKLTMSSQRELVSNPLELQIK